MDRIPGASGILFSDDDSELLTVVGFARQAGPSIDADFLSQRQLERAKEENYVRARSPARPISARLASEQAVILENRFKALLTNGDLTFA
jgi:hypothetical protein